LLEDGLLLWLVAIRNAPAPHPALLQLFPLLLQGMAASTGKEALRVIAPPLAAGCQGRVVS